MLLTECKKGETVEIVKIKNNWAREQVIRFGIVSGVWVTCESIIKSGPVIIRRNNQRIAIGFHVAKEIEVKRGDYCGK